MEVSEGTTTQFYPVDLGLYSVGVISMATVHDDFSDPAGEEHERDRLRRLGRLRFVLLRGVLGFGAPIFLWLALSNLREDMRMARVLHENVLAYMLRSWLT